MCEGRPVSPVFFNLQSLSNLQLHGQKRTFIFCKYYAFLLARDFSMGGCIHIQKCPWKACFCYQRYKIPLVYACLTLCQGLCYKGAEAYVPAVQLHFFNTVNILLLMKDWEAFITQMALLSKTRKSQIFNSNLFFFPPSKTLHLGGLLSISYR